MWAAPGVAASRPGRRRKLPGDPLIRMFVEFWDRVSIDEQERMFGRRRDNGAPLDANGEFDTPDFATDPRGRGHPPGRPYPARQPADPADRR